MPPNTLFPEITITGHHDTPIVTADDAVKLARPYLLGKMNEFLLCIALGADKKPLTMRIVSIGGRNQASISVQDIMRSVIADGSSGVIFLHNHPGGISSHSEQDALAMAKLDSAARTLGIKFECSIVVGTEGYHVASGFETEKTNSIVSTVIGIIDNLGVTLAPIGMLALSMFVFLFYIGNGNVPGNLIVLVLLYPASWFMTMIARVLDVTFGSSRQKTG